MSVRLQTARVVLARLGVGAALAMPLAAPAVLAGCASDEPGRTKTTSKTTVETPTERTTTTETREKETRIIR